MSVVLAIQPMVILFWQIEGLTLQSEFWGKLRLLWARAPCSGETGACG